MTSHTDAALAALHARWHDRFDNAEVAGAEVHAHHTITADMTKAGIDHGCDMPVMVEVYRSTATVEAALANTSLPMHVLAALREAAGKGYTMVDVIGMLGVNGYELRVAEIDGEPDPVPVAEAAGVEVIAEPVDVGMSKGRSFEVENRVIARNRRRKVAQGEHTFVAARWATRAGVRRCVVCGMGQPDGDMCAGIVAARASKADTYTPPQGVRDAAERALGWIADGKAGAGFTATGRARASQLAAGDAVSADVIRRMASYFARHEVDRDAEGFNAGEDGYPTPGRVAWDAWGGDAGRTWAQGIADDLAKSDPGAGAVHVDTIMGGGRGGRIPSGVLVSDEPKRLPADNTGATMSEAGDMQHDGTMDMGDDELAPRQKAMHGMYEAIADLVGVWDQGIGADGAHYIPASDNVFAREGIACESCVFWMGDGMCEIVDGEVEPGGACKLWIVPEANMTATVTDMVERITTVKASVLRKEDERRFTLGPMYVPDFIDAHGEWTDADTLQLAVWDYVRTGDRRIRLQHNREVVAGEWVECMAWPWEVSVPMLDAATGNASSYTYPPNTVFLGVQWEPWAWELVKAGKLRGYSIGGTTDRILADLPNEGNG